MVWAHGPGVVERSDDTPVNPAHQYDDGVAEILTPHIVGSDHECGPSRS